MQGRGKKEIMKTNNWLDRFDYSRFGISILVVALIANR